MVSLSLCRNSNTYWGCLFQVVPCLVQGVQGLMDSGHLALKVSDHHQAQDSGLIVSDHLVNSHVVAHPQRE